jgi:predicted RNA-binding protein YlqC (UPF0109 family)
MQRSILLQQDVVGDLVVRMIQAVVDSPEAVKVDATTESGHTVYRVKVASDEVGQVIGKQGRTARALRVLLMAISVKQRRRMEIDIVGGA